MSYARLQILIFAIDVPLLQESPFVKLVASSFAINIKDGYVHINLNPPL
jgi:hypothetical protein